LYCLEDGTALVQGAVPTADGHETAILPAAVATGDEPTRAQISGNEGTLRGAPPNSRRKAKVVSLFALATIVILGIAFFGYRYSSAEAKQINSIAVLPFENHSGSGDTDYLSDGLTDSLIFRFSQLPNIKVSPTSSVMRYKGSSKDVADIAKELDVDGVLSGRLTQVGDNLSISVQLIDARTKKLVWAEQYDRKMADLLATQREIATTLTQKMQLHLAGDEKGIAKKYTSSSEAYQLYLKGRYFWSKRTKDDLLRSVENYKQAIALDPAFALAYVGMAETYNSMAKDPDVAPKDAVPFAKAAAAHALEIDPTLAEAHSAMGDSLAIYDWNWSEAERELNKALELDPDVAYIHLVYSGSYLGPVGRTADAVRESEKAVELEPAALINNSVLASSYIYARQFDKALAQAKRSVELEPNFPLARYWLAMAYVASGNNDQAISIATEISKDSPAFPMKLVAMGHAYARSGKKADAEEQITELRQLSLTRYIRRYYIASIYASLGDADKAFAELEACLLEKDVFITRVNSDPFMDPIRNDRRFGTLLKRMGLPASAGGHDQ